MPQNALSTRSVRVFVSSTYADLIPARDAAKATIERLRGAEFVGMELFGAREESAEQVSIEEVDDSDLYIGLIGGRWGSGITNTEYRRAREKNLDCLFYVMKEDAIAARDEEGEKREQLAAWRREISDSFDGFIVREFSTPDDLAKTIPLDLHNWLYRRLVKDAQKSAADGQMQLLRVLAQSVRQPEKLREALIENGIASGDDLLETLVSLSPAAARQLVAGIRDLPTDYATRIENFLVNYLGTPDKPVPFGGRADVMRHLDEWLADDAQKPYVLVAAEAGRGKSAVLARFSRKVTSDERYAVVFVPVSIRYRTNLATVFFASLAARLAAVHGAPLPNETNTPPEVWRGIASEYLKRPLADGRKLIVIIDALDEAADWSAAADLFPLAPPDGLRLVVSARLTAKHPTPRAWQEQLGWDDALSISMPLQPLTVGGVHDVVVSMGFPLADLGADAVGQLHRLSEGDPLLVNLYVKELWQKGEAAAALRPDDLRKIEPGLGGYFKRWWSDQKELWGDDAPMKERGVRTVLNLLTCALGPIGRDDLIALAPAESEIDTWTLDDYIRPIERFVIEEKDGLVFSHPRFGQFLYGELKGEAAKWEKLFVTWGKGEVARLASGELSPMEISLYVVEYHAHHLERMKAPVDDLLALLIPPWRQAWERQEGGLSGLLADVHRAWSAVRNAPQLRLADEIYCALCSASIRSLAENIPTELVERLLAEKVWSTAQALAYARNTIEPERKVRAYLAAVPYLDEEDRRAAIEDAIAVTKTLPKGPQAEPWQALAAIDLPFESILEDPFLRGCVARGLAARGKFDEAFSLVATDRRGFNGIVGVLLEAGNLREALTAAADDLCDDGTRMAVVCAALLAGQPVPDGVIERSLRPSFARRFEELFTDRSLPIGPDDAEPLQYLVRQMANVHILRGLAEVLPRVPREMRDQFYDAHFHSEPVLDFLFAAPERRAKAAARVALQHPAYFGLVRDYLHGQRLAQITRYPSYDRQVFDAIVAAAEASRELGIVVSSLRERAEDDRSALPLLMPFLDPSERQPILDRVLAELREPPQDERAGGRLDSKSMSDLAEFAPYLSGRSLLEALEIANRIDDAAWLQIVREIFTATPQTVRSILERYRNDASGYEPRLFAWFARDLRETVIAYAIEATVAGSIDRRRLLDWAWMARMLGEPARTEMSRRVWNEIAEDPIPILESRGFQDFSPPDGVFAPERMEALAVAVCRTDAFRVAALPFLPEEERHAKVREIAGQLRVVDLTPFVVSSLTPELAALIFRAQERDVLGDSSALEAVLPMLPEDCVTDIVAHANEPSVALALLPHVSTDERRQLIEQLLSGDDDALTKLKEYFLQSARPFTAREEVLADFGAAFTRERVRMLVESEDPDADLLAAIIRMKSWPQSDVPQLIRLFISPEHLLTRRNLILGIASLRDPLEDLGGRPLLDAVASAIERVGIMFP